MSSIVEKYNRRVDQVDSLVCLGLDTTLAAAKEHYGDSNTPVFDRNRQLIDATAPYISAVKPNSAFYEKQGQAGVAALEKTIDFLRSHHPNIVTIDDAKRGDIGTSNDEYAARIFDDLGFDAITLHPYLGSESLKVFLDRIDKACILLLRTSNPGAGEVQDLIVDGKPLWHRIAEMVSKDWNKKDNVMGVAGATYPDELAVIRSIVGEMTLLVPGIGTQGGKVEEVIPRGKNDQGKGLIINASRGIAGAKDPAVAAKKLRDEINLYR